MNNNSIKNILNTKNFIACSMVFILSACVPEVLNQGADVDGESSSLTLSASIASETEVRLSWDPGIGTYSAYQFFQVFGTTEVGVANAGASTREALIDVGNVPGQTLTFRVKATVPGAEEQLGDTATAIVKMPSVGVAWQMVTSAGPSIESTTKILLLDSLDADEAFINLRWDNKSNFNVSTWKLYRAESPGFTSISLTPIYSGTNKYFLDTDEMTAGKRYYYLVAGFKANGDIVTLSRETYVRVPPEHQILVHRESANYEMCGLLSSDMDPANFNRCAFSGLGSTGGYYDFGKLLFVDRYELGVNVTTDAGACGGGSTGCAKYPYLTKPGGSATPSEYLANDTLMATGDVTYINNIHNINQLHGSLGGAQAIIKIDNPESPGEKCMAGIGYTGIQCQNSAGTLLNLPDSSVDFINGVQHSYQKGYTNAPKKIPATISFYTLGRVGTFDLAHKYGACSKRSTSGFGSSRVPLRSEQVVYSAWPLSKERYEASAIVPEALEQSTDHLYAGSCNTQMFQARNQMGIGNTTNNSEFQAGGVLAGTNVYPEGDLVRKISDELTPGGVGLGRAYWTNTNYLLAVTGSDLTKNCVSRYGVQDHIGNAGELADLRFNFGTNPNEAIALGEANGYKMDGIMAPGSGAAISISPPTGATFEDRPRSCIYLNTNPYVGESGPTFTHFLPTLGLPYLDSSQGALPLGSGLNSINVSQLGENYFCVIGDLLTGSYSNRYAITGGNASYQYGDPLGNRYGANPMENTTTGVATATAEGKGRWSLAYSNTHYSGYSTGIRCVTEDQ